MASWTSLALLSALAVSALSLPRPDESAYKIPQVGTGRRSQYYVLHNDGTYKYGYDTGDGAFESARLKQAGRQDGEFGYRDPDGNTVTLQYKAGEGGFVAKGDHIPAPHPDFDAAHAAARARPPFVDPLADGNTDASYGFQFAEDGLARVEQSDSDGNVRGSYTYTDEEGRTRTYTYTAGRGTGFVIEGDDLPQAPEAPGATPAATRLSSSAGRFSASRATGTTSSTASAVTAFRASSASPRRPARPFSGTSATTSGSFSTQYRSPTASRTTAVSHTPSITRTSTAFRRPTFTGAQTQYTTSSQASTRQQTRPFEPANTRSQLTSDGGYAFAYETSSHSRAESGDGDNNVVGEFDFVADDDGQRRAIQYEASSATGFIAEGAHIPVGPEVPGAPSGQPTGKIVPVQEVPFIDPLADSNTDASYNFGFESEQYSRTETADADGNVQGTYTVVDDDGTRRTYRFRAGEGVGFETEEVSSSRGPPPSRPASATYASTLHGSAGTATSSAAAGAVSVGPSTTYSVPSPFRGTSSARRPATQTSVTSRPFAYTQPATFSSSTSPLRTSFTQSTRQELFPGFTLNQYAATDNAEKYGYVLKFD
ncbi:uncharacterized protein [Panulirus ornatus]|uniref:uncharacterized protein n=1 Tax=Panulirus ornatus TaxID=150431 RepID=UPI003A8B9682